MAVIGHHAGRGIDREGNDLVGRIMRDLLDVHAAFGRNDESDAGRLAVDEHGQIELACNRRAVFDIEPVHLLSGWPGLHRDERAREHLLREALDVLDAFGEPHAALVAGASLLEPALAAPARMDLALDHEERAAELLRGGFGLVRREGRLAARDRHAKLPEHRLGLIFMDVHRANPWRCRALKHRVPSGRRSALPARHRQRGDRTSSSPCPAKPRPDHSDRDT